MKQLLQTFALLALVVSAPVQAETDKTSKHGSDIVESVSTAISESLKKSVNYHAYISVNGSISDADDRLNSITGQYVSPEFRGVGNRFTFDPGSLAALQIELDLTEKLTFISQFIGRGINSFDVRANWIFLRYQALPELVLHIGLIRVPPFLFSDFVDVGFAYPWPQVPEEVYSLMPIPNLAGGQVIYTKAWDDWSLEVQPYVGGTQTTFRIGGFTPFDLRADQVAGLQVSLQNSNITFHTGVLRALISFPQFPITVPANPPTLPLSFTIPTVKEKETVFANAALQIDYKGVLSISEFAYRHVEGYLSDAFGWYSLLGFRYKKLLVHATYASTRSLDKTNRDVTASAFNNAILHTVFDKDQDRVELGLRYEVNEKVALKASVERVFPRNRTNGLFTLAPGEPVNLATIAVHAAI